MKKLYDKIDEANDRAKRYGYRLQDINKKPCFAWKDLETCSILKEKDCYECKFYKAIGQLDAKNKELLGI